MSKSSHISEAIILAGGLGTRLRDSIGEHPKPLAPIVGKPFLSYLLDYLSNQGITKVILAVGYKWELIQAEFGSDYKGIEISYAIEEHPLGTGGAIKLASQQTTKENCFVLNGDTLCTIELNDLSDLHKKHTANCTLALKSMTNSERYGSVKIDSENQIVEFQEKAYRENSMINGGVYCLNIRAFNQNTKKDTFSFESDYLELNVRNKLFGLITDAYFKDIGIPSDYSQFEQDILNNSIHGI